MISEVFISDAYYFLLDKKISRSKAVIRDKGVRLDKNRVYFSSDIMENSAIIFDFSVVLLATTYFSSRFTSAGHRCNLFKKTKMVVKSQFVAFLSLIPDRKTFCHH